MTKKYAVLYTDGSARPQNKYIGWGAHGYIYDDAAIGVKTGNRHTKYVMTNVGYIENGDILKIPHEIVSPNEYFDWCGATSYYGTNNIAELLAIIKSLEKLYELGVNDILIKSDSSYSLLVLSKMYDIDTDRDLILDELKTNKEYWIRVKDILDKFISIDAKLVFTHVKAHSVHLGNIKADKLALLGRIKSERSRAQSADVLELDLLDVLPAKGYWKPKSDRHYFMTFKQLFFFDNTFKHQDGSMIYSFMNYKDETEMGKKSPSVSYGLIYLPEAIEKIVEIGDIYKELSNNVHSATTVRLDTLYSAPVLRLYESFGKEIYYPDLKSRKKSIYVLKQPEDLHESLVMNEIYPQGISNVAENNTMLLEKVLHKYRTNKVSDDITSYIDITSEFYMDKDGKNVIRPDFDNNVELFKIPYTLGKEDVFIPLKPSSDIPNRNLFKKIEKLEPKVTLICINFDNVKVEYYTVIELSTGEILLYCNFYGRSVFIVKDKKRKK